MPVGPNPHSSTPRTYRNNGITVIGPANINKSIIGGLAKVKSFDPSCIIK